MVATPTIRADIVTVTGEPRLLGSGGVVYPVTFASAGVYQYPEHGFAELVPPEVLSDEAFVGALVGLPVILGDATLHLRGVRPGGSLEGARVGTILSARWDDEQQAIVGEVVIDEQPGLDAVAEGIRGVSLRYEVVDSVSEVGTFAGMRYARRQTGRTRPNHLILAARGRDPRARIAADMEPNMDEIVKLLRERADMDGSDLMRALVEMLVSARDDAKTARMEADGYMAERDAMRADLDAMKAAAMAAEAEESEDVNRADAAPAVGPVRAVLALADKHGVTVEDAATVADVQRAVVAKALGKERADALDDAGLTLALDIIARAPRADAFDAAALSAGRASALSTLLSLE